MATPIRCSGCGRDYPGSRFPVGRSLRCACGARVGSHFGSGVRRREGEPRFFADSMLAGLARRLRALGYDAAWEPAIPDAELVRRGAEEGRWVLTRDRGLVDQWWADHLVLLASDQPLGQLAEVHRLLDLHTHGMFSRCTRCNELLRRVPAERRGELPPEHRDAAARTGECPACQRLYWPGSHARRMRAALERAVHGT